MVSVLFCNKANVNVEQVSTYTPYCTCKNLWRAGKVFLYLQSIQDIEKQQEMFFWYLIIKNTAGKKWGMQLSCTVRKVNYVVCRFYVEHFFLNICKIILYNNSFFVLNKMWFANFYVGHITFWIFLKLKIICIIFNFM